MAREATAKRRRRTTSNIAAVDRAPGRGKYDRTRTPDERQKDQRSRLLDAAARVFAEKGWAEATVEAIVVRAGMSRRTFYEHFDDLKDCLLTLHDRVTRAAVRAVETQIVGVEDPAELLRLGVMGFLGGIAAFPHIARVMFRVVREAGPEFEPMHDRMMARFMRLMNDGVQLAYEQKKVAEPPDELRVFALCSAMEAVAMRYVMRGEEEKALDAAPILIEMVTKVFS
jgi:AcrR family transcriptional regulator